MYDKGESGFEAFPHSDRWLDLALEEYAQSGVYPFHMPGHKRHRSLFMNSDGNAGITHPFSYDITEISGFDNLADPDGMIADMLTSLAWMYGAKRAWLSMNGSTGGMYAAIFAATKRGDTILIERCSHRCVYDAAMLRGLKVRFIENEAAQGGWRAAVSHENVEKSLKDNDNVTAVVITSPTYEGETADVLRIAGICHTAGARLIVDGAHGAHLGFHNYFPPSPTRQNADLVVMSLHKTLPVMGQAAAVFSGNKRLNVARYINIMNTSSPSYVIMASVSNAVRRIRENGDNLFNDYVRRLMRFYDASGELSNMSVALPNGDNKRDPSKIVITTAGCMSGPMLMETLRRRYKIELEMCGRSYCLAMTSIADTDAGFKRLIDALRFIDAKNCRNNDEDDYNPSSLFHIPKRAYEIFETESMPYAQVELSEAKGKISGGYICPYPPGTPVIVPGEIFDDETIAAVSGTQAMGIKNGRVLCLL